MKKHLLTMYFLCAVLPVVAQYNTAKPWAYWWWPGSAVDSAGIKYNLQKYAKAGFGGLHIIPIYGVKGEEPNFIPFLSPRWLQMLEYSTKEAKKLGLGIDLTMGTGWPFGGPQVSPTDAAKKFQIFQNNGQNDVKVLPTGQKVKRAAPGAEGLVLDHFNKKATENYLKPYQNAFGEKDYGFRALYNDSYEVYGANWTDNFLEKFEQYRGYTLKPHLAVLDSTKIPKTDYEHRIWHDYHQTLSDLMVQEFNPTWTSFVKSIAKVSRNEAHGSPANLLDLYAQNDIPESEFFGSKHFDIKGYKQDPDYSPERFGTPGIEVVKLASSPAHVMGKKLVSSETATWLGNHFKVSLAQIKPIVDESFLGGINHIFYHGATYSPPRAAWPGWLFYASTNFNYNSHFWNELPQLNKYIERVQSKLQNTQPDNELLVYFPIHELWTTPGPDNKTHFTNIHNILTHGMFKGLWGQLLKDLKNAGFSYDFISDAQLEEAKITNGQIITKAGTVYKGMIIPEMEYLPLATMQQLAGMQQKGVKLLFQNKIPTKVANYINFEANQGIFDSHVKALKGLESQNVAASLQQIGFTPEPMAASGLSFIRKKSKKGSFYFVANHTAEDYNEKLKLNSPDIHYLFTNPLNGVQFQSPSNQLNLKLGSGQSIMIEGQSTAFSSVKKVDKKGFNETVQINGHWKLRFLAGAPSLPKTLSMGMPYFWTSQNDSSYKYFSGRALYSSHFSLPSNYIGKAAIIKLGNVRESATVKINGKLVGTAWSLPFNLSIPKGLLKNKNTIEIAVQNLSANRIKYMDTKKVDWKKFYDINIVDINYKAFDASHWEPQEAGLNSIPLLEF
jgi:hypothetical protein